MYRMLNESAQLGWLVPGNNEMVALEETMPVLVAVVGVVGVAVRAARRVAPVLELLLVVLQRHQRREQAVARAAAASDQHMSHLYILNRFSLRLRSH
ncbi:unnamed protein product [Euphydryas editha]|uniref:Uncharacterized protein n=1 Tax=Euphydryas editha TaxID=104508 RepID=A0AAU9TEM2_EUPED|nr:unnamed protein product [Euphydryas editha]